jgi:signal transduction histidine kinase
LAFLGQFLVTGGVLLYVQQASQRTVIAAEREAANELRDDLMAVYRAGGSAAVSRNIAERFRTSRDENIAILLADRHGEALAGNLSAWPATVPGETSWRSINLYRVGRVEPEPIGVVAQPLSDGNRLLTGVVVANSLRLAAIHEEALSIAFAVSLVLTLAMAIILGRILARQVWGIAATAQEVSVGALHHRVDTDGSGQSINAMLERIDSLVSQLRMMTDGLAHDLKSPVTRLMAVIEQASTRTQDESALDALEDVRREAETLQSMLSTALLISRTEAGFGADMLRETDLGKLLADIAEIYGPLAEESGFTLAVDAPDQPLLFPVHRELLSQAVANLIENALKYADAGDQILLAAGQEGATARISVSDNGPGIAADQHEEALQRFGRLDPARGKPGSGLGLSLVRAVARLHHGAVTLEDAGPGLRVTLELRRTD